MENERGQFLQNLFVEATEKLYGLESLNDSEENLSIVNDHLKKGSAVVYFNHVSMIDPPTLIAYLYEHLDNMRTVAASTSRRHQDIKQKPLDSLALSMAPLVNVEVLPIVQRKDYDLYPDERWDLVKRYLGRSQEILGKPGGVMIIAPEGTRSQGGQLLKAESGFEKFGNYGQVKYVPVAVIPKGKFNRGLWIGNMSFNVGEPFDINDPFTPDSLRPVDAAMVKLANLLPEDMRGQYLAYTK